MQNSAEGRCTIPAPSRPPPPGDSIDWCITLHHVRRNISRRLKFSAADAMYMRIEVFLSQILFVIENRGDTVSEKLWISANSAILEW